MAVQTIPEINEMTPAQQIELMEALWRSMSKKSVNNDPPEWHRNYLADRVKALENGEDEFMAIDEFESELRSELK